MREDGQKTGTYCFFGLFHASFYGSTLGIIVDEGIDLIFAENLDILFGVEFLGAGMPACRARHGRFWATTS